MLELPAELTHAQAGACLQGLVQGLRDQPEPQVLLNAAALTRFDSSALAVLLELRRECLVRGKTLALQATPTRLADLAHLYGIDSLLLSPSADPVK
jgi:phospholipid transport system transporter-binding protein